MSSSKTFSAIAITLFFSTGCGNGHNAGDLENNLSSSDAEANVLQFSNSLEIVKGKRVFGTIGTGTVIPIFDMRLLRAYRLIILKY